MIDPVNVPVPDKPSGPTSLASDKALGAIILRNLPQLMDLWFVRHFDRVWLKEWGIHGTNAEDLTFLKDSYLKPTLTLLAHYLNTSDARFLALYLDERLRYAPHRANAKDRVRFFNELVAGDIEDITVLFHPTGKSKESPRVPQEGLPLKSNALPVERLWAIHRSLVVLPQGKPLQVLSLGDCLMNEVRVFISQACEAQGFQVDFRSLYFSASENSELSPKEALAHMAQNKLDAIAVSFFTFDGLRSYSRLLAQAETLSDAVVATELEQIGNSIKVFLLELREHTQAPFLLHNASGLPLGRWRKRLPLLPALSPAKARIIKLANKLIADVVEHVPNCILVDELKIAGSFGLKNMSKDVLPRNIRKGALVHTSVFGEKLAARYAQILKIVKTHGKLKAILVDFDNTLWNGVMGEGKVEHYVERQQLLLKLKDAGIVLVSVSKNSPENIRWDEILLKPEDFALHKIGWGLKAQSVAEIAQELNLGLDSFIFVDDNPAERELVRNAHPKVLVADALENTTWEALGMMLSLPNTQATQEAKTRTLMYQEQVMRQAALKSNLDYPQMMASLGLKLAFREAVSSELTRLDELINRTNQFNTTTLRLSKQDLKAKMADSAYRVYVTELEDKFGAMGIIGAQVLKIEGDNALIEVFVMSCRAMGYCVELEMLARCTSSLPPDVTLLTGRYLPTDRNDPCKDVFERSGFTPTTDTDWVYNIKADGPLKRMAWLNADPIPA